MYTAARTKLINDKLSSWLKNGTDKQYQVLNLGAGLDTRQYWLDCLTTVKLYLEVDAASVMDHKQKVLNQLKEKGELPQLLCDCKSISMDFSKESVADLPSKHGYDAAIPTGWILEGLIMYLKRKDVEQLMDTISDLSASNSYLILNFSDNCSAQVEDACPLVAEIGERLEGKGWKKEPLLMFGDEGFSFNRYPTGKPANKILGFAMYQKV